VKFTAYCEGGHGLQSEAKYVKLWSFLLAVLGAIECSRWGAEAGFRREAFLQKHFQSTEIADEKDSNRQGSRNLLIFFSFSIFHFAYNVLGFFLKRTFPTLLKL
jgi:hypothetical protein